MGKIKVVLDPEQRREHINRLLELDGLSHVEEDPQAAYCPISLTQTPDELKGPLNARQQVLMRALRAAGITPYDPASAPFSPEQDLSAQPNEVYVVDSGKIVGARFFVGHNVLPSTGQGVEMEKAKAYNRVAVIMMDRSVRVSRMQPHRTVYLQYGNFEKEADRFIPVFELLQEFEPGMGFNGPLPVLLGFAKQGTAIVDLEEKVYREFPSLQYRYDGSVPILKLRAENPGLFYEKRLAG